MANYFCHQCNVRIPNVNDDFTCPNCRSGFVEAVEDAPGPESDDEQMLGQFGSGMDFLQLLLGGLSGNPSGRRTARGGGSSSTSNASSGATSGVETSQNAPQGATGTSQPTSAADPPPRTPGTHRRRQPHFQVVIDGGGSQINMGGVESFDNFLMLINDMLLGLDPRGAAGQFRVGPGGNFSLGDYVIGGRESLDAIITQLMNQAEGQGPPPLKEDKISSLKETPVTQGQLDAKLQCSVCWEDFLITDKVIQLECEHIYHPDCILPWLKLHGTCPVCRKDLNDPSPDAVMQESSSAQHQANASAPNSSSGSVSGNSGSGPGGIHDELMEFD